MPYSAEGNIFYTTNGEVMTLEHGQPVRNEEVNGVAVKQVNSPITAGTETADVIAKGENYAIICKGVVEVPKVAETKVGETIYIKTAENKLAKGAGEGKVAFGLMVEDEKERGTAAGNCRIDLDLA